MSELEMSKFTSNVYHSRQRMYLFTKRWSRTALLIRLRQVEGQLEDFN